MKELIKLYIMSFLGPDKADEVPEMTTVKEVRAAVSKVRHLLPNTDSYNTTSVGGRSLEKFHPLLNYDNVISPSYLYELYKITSDETEQTNLMNAMDDLDPLFGELMLYYRSKRNRLTAYDLARWVEKTHAANCGEMSALICNDLIEHDTPAFICCMCAGKKDDPKDYFQHCFVIYSEQKTADPWQMLRQSYKGTTMMVDPWQQICLPLQEGLAQTIERFQLKPANYSLLMTHHNYEVKMPGMMNDTYPDFFAISTPDGIEGPFEGSSAKIVSVCSGFRSLTNQRRVAKMIRDRQKNIES